MRGIVDTILVSMATKKYIQVWANRWPDTFERLEIPKEEYAGVVWEEDWINILLNRGWNLVGVSYVGGCRSTGQHVYHFVS